MENAPFAPQQSDRPDPLQSISQADGGAGTLFSQIRPLRLGEFAEEYLHHVKSHKSASWHRKQTNHIHGTILTFFGADTLTTAITSRRIEEYAEWRREKVKGTVVNKELLEIIQAGPMIYA